jgi:plasmid stability protein
MERRWKRHLHDEERVGGHAEALMAGQAITLHLPDDLYARLKRQAEETHRSVEEELVDIVSQGIPRSPTLPDDLAVAVSQLALLPDEALWRAARSHFPAKAATRLETLHLKRQRAGLDQIETQELAGLMRQYERAMLVRARAAALLAERGHDVSSLRART